MVPAMREDCDQGFRDERVHEDEHGEHERNEGKWEVCHDGCGGRERFL